MVTQTLSFLLMNIRITIVHGLPLTSDQEIINFSFLQYITPGLGVLTCYHFLFAGLKIALTQIPHTFQVPIQIIRFFV